MLRIRFYLTRPQLSSCVSQPRSLTECRQSAVHSLVSRTHERIEPIAAPTAVPGLLTATNRSEDRPTSLTRSPLDGRHESRASSRRSSDFTRTTSFPVDVGNAWRMGAYLWRPFHQCY